MYITYNLLRNFLNIAELSTNFIDPSVQTKERVVKLQTNKAASQGIALRSGSDLHQIIETLPQIGLEIESIEYNNIKYKNFKIAKVLAVKPHPNANNLNICQVSLGDSEVQVVCGARNVRPGIIVVFAEIGAIVPANGMQIEAAKIRGEYSYGMLCSLEELQLENLAEIFNSEGIVELSEGFNIGEDLAKALYLDEVVLELAVLPNRRQDCLSVAGVARSLAASNEHLVWRTEEKLGDIEEDAEAPGQVFESEVGPGDSSWVRVKDFSHDILDNFWQAAHGLPHNFLEKPEKLPNIAGSRDVIDRKLIDGAHYTSEKYWRAWGAVAELLEQCGSGVASKNSGRKLEKIAIDSAIIPEIAEEFILLQLCDIASVHLSNIFSARGGNNRQMIGYLLNIGKLNRNMLVNISNFSMFCYGRPSHFYDLGKIRGSLSVSLSVGGESFIALGGKELILPEGLPILRDEEKILSILGVMGGELSKVDDASKDIILELAIFSQQMICKMLASINLTSEAALRFAARVNYDNSPQVLAGMLRFLARDYKASLTGIFAYKSARNIAVDTKKVINFPVELLRKKLNIYISEAELMAMLDKLGFFVLGQLVAVGKEVDLAWERKILTLLVPAWRQGDIVEPEDMLEEILLVYGVNNLIGEATDDGAQRDLRYFVDIMKKSATLSGDYTDQHDFMAKYGDSIRDLLAARGCYEVINFPFISAEYLNMLGLKQDFILVNPINQQKNQLRNHLLPSLLENIVNNVARDYSDLSLFEMSKVFSREEAPLSSIKNPLENSNNALNSAEADAGYVLEADGGRRPQTKREDWSLVGVRCGEILLNGKLWNKEEEYSFYAVREDLVAIFSQVFGLSSNYLDYTMDNSHLPAYYHPGRSAAIYYAGMLLGYCGELHPGVADKLACGNLKINIFELNFIEDLRNFFLKESSENAEKSQCLFNFPKISRDFAFVIDAELPVGSLVNFVRNLEVFRKNSIKVLNIKPFDLYKMGKVNNSTFMSAETIGGELKAEFKSVAIRLELQPEVETASEEQLREINNVVISEVERQFAAKLR